VSEVKLARVERVPFPVDFSCKVFVSGRGFGVFEGTTTAAMSPNREGHEFIRAAESDLGFEALAAGVCR
jgi:hypothetical protein